MWEGRPTWVSQKNNLTNNHLVEYGLLEFIVSPTNLNAAYLQVKRNNGAGGVDKMEVESLQDYLITHKEELLASIQRGKYCFIKGQLFLRVNKEESKVCHIREVKFLGYSFYKHKGEGRLRIHPKRVEKMKAKIKKLTSRSKGWGNTRRKEALRQYITGWVQYFKLADMNNLLLRVDAWYRRRIRMVIWKQWKRIKTKLSKLIKLGVKKSKAWEWANTRKSYWRVAGSYILSTTITNDRLRKAGYVFLSDYYRKVRIVNEGTAVYENRMYGGVRGRKIK